MINKIKDKKQNPKLSNLYGVIFYSNNKNPDIVNINKFNDVFHHKGRSYFISFENVMKMKVNRWLVKHDFYLFYFYDNYEPIKINESEMKMSTKNIPNKIIHTIMKSNALTKIEKSENKFNLDNIDMKMIIIIGVILVIGWYFISGGSLT